MILKSIKLENFTNYKKEIFILSKGLNIFIGNNAQGKSNFLDSIFYTSMEMSSRNKKDIELILWNETYFKISAFFDNKYNKNNNVVITFDTNKKEKKKICLNNNEIEKIKQYIGYFNVVYFSPEDLYIIKGDPSTRRKYIDNQLLQTEKKYYICLNNYKKILEQKNKLLKKNQVNNNIKKYLEVWDEQLSKYGTIILKTRLENIERIKKIAKEIHFDLTEGKELLEVEYETKLPITLLKSGQIDSFQSIYFETLKKYRKNDLIKGYTTIGPHREDLIFKINNISAKKYASQGQQRTLVLSLKITELELIKEKKQEYPIFLLDDVLSELDKKRKNKLFKIINKNIQTIITSTDLNDLNKSIQKEAKIFEINKNN